MAAQEVSVDPRPITIVETAFKDQLTGLLRYARFMSGETPQQWVHLLGPDVLSLSHPHVTADITREFITFNNRIGGHEAQTAAEEQQLLVTTAYVHDWGELKVKGVGVGDVSFDQKTHGDEAVEETVFDLVLDTVPDDAGVDKDFLRRAYEEVVRGKPGRLWEMFNAIERIGYLQTAIRAFEGVDGQRIENWRGLVGNVLSNQIVALTRYAETYPYVQFILDRENIFIHRMFDAVLSEQVPPDADEKPSYDMQRLLKASNTWIQHSIT